MSKTHRRKHRRRKQRAVQPGSPPGIVVADESARPSSVVAVSYGQDETEFVERATAADAIALRSKRQVLWVHIEGVGDAALIRELGDAFGLHGLALEDSVTHHQHVKVEDYGDHLFLVTRLAPDGTEHETRQLSMFVTEQVLVTLCDTPTELVATLRPRLDDAHSKLRRKGTDFLAYAILDVVLDQYFPLLEQFGERLDDLEVRITDHPPRAIIHEVHDVRVELRDVRRVVWQQREAINTLLRGENALISDVTHTYLRDCHDHTIQLVELLEVDHETCSDLRDIYLSAISNRLNEVMMVLTIIATIFIPLSFIASLYGMNFRPEASPLNMPETTWYFGYPFALGLMAATAAGMLLFFRHRGWIWQSRRTPEEPPDLSQ